MCLKFSDIIICSYIIVIFHHISHDHSTTPEVSSQEKLPMLMALSAHRRGTRGQQGLDHLPASPVPPSTPADGNQANLTKKEP